MIKKVKELLSSNPLIANSLNLMLATAMAALFGFIFWVVVAHAFRASIVGLATTLLSASSLIALLGLAGFDTVFIRYLAKSKRKNDQINSGLVISGIASVVIAGIFCLLIPLIAPKLDFVDHSLLYIAIFIISTIFATWNVLTNAIFIAYRKTSFILAINVIFSAIKMIFPFAIHSGGVMVIFTFVGLAQLVNVALSVWAMMRYFQYRPSLKIHFDIVHELRHYSLVVYLSNLFNLLPDSILPLIVIDKLGAAAAAYFYIAFTIANLLYTVAFSTTQALFAEGANDEKNFALHIRKGIKIIASLMTPAIMIVFVLCPFVLSLFGHNYVHGASGLLRILTISSVAVTLYSGMGVIFKMAKNLRATLAMTSANAVTIILLSLYLVNRWGLAGVGWAWLIGSFASVGVGFLFLRRGFLKGVN